VATLNCFQITDTVRKYDYVIFLSNSPNEEPKREKSIRKLGQALAKPEIMCRLEQKSVKTKFLKIL
jgi:hypothetical protein